MKTLKKFIGGFKILADTRFLMALFGLIAVLVPATAPWLAINSGGLVTSITGVSAGLSLLFAYLSESPKSRDIRLKGGVKK